VRRYLAHYSSKQRREVLLHEYLHLPRAPV